MSDLWPEQGVDPKDIRARNPMADAAREASEAAKQLSNAMTAHPKKSESIEASELIQQFIDKLPIKATEIGWEKIGEDAQELEQALEALYNQRIEQAESDGRIKEHEEWVLYFTEAAHSWEQDGEGSGIQYFDGERLDRYKQLKATRAGITSKEVI